jgi:hypothetical protein
VPHHLVMTMNHLRFQDIFELCAPPERVFPLLCPVREHEWIPTWRAKILQSVSGVAELDCVFLTDSPSDGTKTWICTRYEPNREISYTAFSTLGYIMRLDISLAPIGGGRCSVSWWRRFIAVNETGDSWINSIDRDAIAKATLGLSKLLDHYLATGTMLRP